VIEACVECQCPSLRIADLGLSMLQGEVAWVDEAKARASADLGQAKRAGAVTIKWIERCQVSRSPQPPFMKRLKPNWAAASQVAPVEEKPSQMDAAALDAVSQEVTRLKAQIQAQQGSQEALRALVTRAVQEALRGTIGQPSRAPDATGRPTDDPVYIPSNIVDRGKTDDIQMSTESSGTASVDDAAQALKTAKGSGRRRGRRGGEDA